MEVSSEKNRAAFARRITTLAVLVYFASYMTRINFSAIISEFIIAESVSKTAASLVVTALTFTYAVGQLVSGYLGDKIKPQRLILIGLLTAVGMNILLPLFSPNITVMSVVWAINGFAQAFMWPPLVKIFSVLLTDAEYVKAIPMLGFSTGGANVLTYLLSPLIISLFGWKYVFIPSVFFGLIITALWISFSKKHLADADFSKRPEEKSENRERAKLPVLLISVIVISIAVQGLLRDGISTWTPSLISDMFNMSSSISILTSVVLPIFHIVGNFLIYAILRRLKYRAFSFTALLFGIMSLTVAGFRIFGTGAFVLSLLLLAVISVCIYGINSMQTACFQNYFKESGNISFLSGVFNFGTYAGSTVSTYLFALLSDKYGWNFTLTSWALFAALGFFLTVICGIFIRKKGYSFRRSL